MTWSSLRVLLMLPLCLLPACRTAQPTASALPSAGVDVSQAAFSRWVDRHVETLKPLEKARALTHWQATGSGKSEDYDAAAAAELALEKLYTNPEDFRYLKAVREAGLVKDPLLARQLELYYLDYLGNQFDPMLLDQTIKLSSQIEARFNVYRADVDGRKLADNEVEAVLRMSTNSAERKKVWEASKQVGSTVEKDLIALVKLRNESARQLGYANYYVLALAMGEQDEKELFALLDDMAQRTEAPFREVKTELDNALAKRYNIKPSELRPWHYEDRFFQEPPSIGAVDLDPIYKGQDPIELSAQYYASIGLDVRGVIARSDLRGREGKYQHAYCTDVDRAGDVRVMESAEDNAYWMDTTLHELGHAVYSLGHDANPELPYRLKDAAHTLSTEGVAMLMGRLTYRPAWMQRFLKLDPTKAASLEGPLFQHQRAGSLVFARWCQVMAHFERDLYANPDQDLNALWWKYVAQYQLLTPPEGRNAPDWAAKIHLVSSPVYYHNYLLGDLYAMQLHDVLAKKFFPGQTARSISLADNKEIGAFLDEKVFKPGQRLRWDAFVKESTGEPLSARAFAEAYIGGPK